MNAVHPQTGPRKSKSRMSGETTAAVSTRVVRFERGST
jgi:hypothetical protein